LTDAGCSMLDVEKLKGQRVGRWHSNSRKYDVGGMK
jgi:hypothetical protein